MTCIVGLRSQGKIMMGADTFGSNSERKIGHPFEQPKIFKKDKLLIGCSSSYRMMQILQHVWEPPERTHPTDKNKWEWDNQFLFKEIIPSIMSAFRTESYGKKEKGEQKGGEFLIGYYGRLYFIQEDFSALEPSRDFHAIGSGAKYALAVLYHTQRSSISPEARIAKAIIAASEFCLTVNDEIHIESL